MARPQETPIWRITGRDVIEQGEAFTFECERVVSVTGPDPSSIPGWLSGLLEGDLDREGFLLSDSVHGLAGRSFRSGVFAVGEVTGNLDLLRVIVQARAVAGQVRSWMLRSDRAAHDVSVSVAESCIRCLTCYRLCPHAAISFAAAAAHSRMQIWPGSCEECGICVSECPRCSLDLVGYPDEGWREVLSEVAGSPRSDLVVMFACKRSAARLAQQGNIPATARVITVPCAGRVSEAMIWAALAGGARGIVVAGCHPGNCASETGNQWARSRVAQMNEALIALVGPKPLPAVIYLPVAANEPARFARMLEEYCSRVS